MNILSYKMLMITAGVLTILSCNLDNEQMPDQSTELRTTEALLRSATIQVTYNQHSLSGRTAGILLQYFDRLESSILYVENYNVPEFYMESYWTNGLYEGSLKAADDLLQLGREEGNANAEGIANVILALEFANATTSFGDIPYSQALRGSEGIIQPAVDQQEEVYVSIMDQLTNAIGLLSQAIDPQIAGGDPLHGGDIGRWKKLAYGLRARYGNQLVAKGLWTAEQVLQDVDQSYQSSAEQGMFQFQLADNLNHPIRSFVEQRPFTIAGSPTFSEALTERDDPRLRYYYSKDESGNLLITSLSPDVVWTKNQSLLPWLSFAELQFIKAERLVLTGAGNAELSFILKLAITASLEQMSIDPNSHLQFINQHSTITPSSTVEQKIQQVISEAYYSYYGCAWHEAWSNYRRTGYPELSATGGPNENNPSGTLPERYLYPREVSDLNAANYDKARSRQNGALLDVPLWIFDI